MNLPYFQPHEKPYGMTFGGWTVKWWQWLLSKASDINPAIDPTGKNGSIDQNRERVWFLAGTFDKMDPARREIRIPSNRSILLPAICYQANFIEDPIFSSEEDLECHVRNDIDDIVEHLVTVDDIEIGTYRIMSDPIVFPIKLAKDIPHGQHSAYMKKLEGDVDTNAVAEGYWAFIKPLLSGQHNLHLKGSCGGGIRKTEAFYKILIED